MPETGIENLIRGDGSSSEPGGCTGPLIASVIFTLVLLIGLGLLASYCGGDTDKGTEPAVNNSR